MKNLEAVSHNKSNGTRMIRNIIIIVLILIIILLGVFAYLYFMTDVFKTNKQLFFENFGQIFDEENGIVDTSLIEYAKKQQEMPYENNGKFYSNIEIGDKELPENFLDTINEFRIEYSGKTDKKNNKAEQNIKLHYSDDVEWPFIYRHNGDFYGIQTDTVSEKYVTIENNNLKSLVQKLGIEDVSQIPDKIDFTNNAKTIEYSEEEKAQIKEKYTEVLNQDLQEEQFTKEKNGEETTYILTTSNDDFTNLIIDLLKTLQNDDITLQKLNELTGEDTYNSEFFEEIISELEDTNVVDGTIIISIKETNSQFTSIEIKSEGNAEILISKEKANNGEIKYNVNISTNSNGTEIKMNLKSEYQGIDTLQNVKETHQIGIEFIYEDESQRYNYNIENNINFVQSIDVDDLTEDNSIILNNYDSDVLQNFTGALAQRIVDVNTDQMDQLNFEYGNPMLYLVPGTSTVFSLINSANEIIEDSNMSEAEIEAFNNRFKKYEGTQKGTMTKALIQEIEANNIEYMEQDDTKVEIEFYGIENLDDDTKYGNNAKNYIDNSKDYQVNLEYAENGRVNKVIIEGEFLENNS